jgi:lysophosphatidate acyltransferase
MFPEGTRSRQLDSTLLPFKKGAFYLAKSGEIPIIPIVISTYGEVYNSKKMNFEGGLIRIKGMRICVLIRVVMDSIETNKDMNVNDLIERTRDAMSATLKEISSNKND